MKTGNLIVSRGNYEITKKKEIEEYYSILMPLYKKYGYKPVMRGKKTTDIHGFTVQMYIGMGFFPTPEQALECHYEADYIKASKLRDKFMTSYQLTLFGKPEHSIFNNLEDGYKTAGNEYAEEKTFMVFRNNLNESKLEKIAEYTDEIDKIMKKYGYEPFY